MEKPLVVPLFERTSRSLGLTAAGQALLPEARAVLAATYQLRRTAGAQRRQLSGRLAARTMGAEAAMRHTRAVLHALQDRHPHIGVPLLRVATVAVMHCLIAVEIVLRDRIPGAGGKPLRKLIEQSADAWRDSVRHQDARARGALPGWAP